MNSIEVTCVTCLQPVHDAWEFFKWCVEQKVEVVVH